jgi:hypothetical protein
MQGESQYIRMDRIAAIFIPGLIQYQNEQQEKAVIFLCWTIGLLISWFWYLDRPNNYLILIVAGVMYVYSIFDSLIIYNGQKRKRVERPDDVEKYFRDSHNKTKKTYYYLRIEKGERFEKFVLNKFDAKDFSIVKRTFPIQGPGSHYNENNLDPDFSLRYIPSREKFAVEAKIRSKPYNSKIIEWCKTYQLPRYKQFEYDEKIPVYIVIGIGDIPENPERMFLVPLKNVKSNELSLEFLSEYEMDPKSKFTWKPGGFWNSGHLKTKRLPRKPGV